MIGNFLIGSLVISCLLFFNKNKWVNYSLVVLYSLLMWALVYYEYHHLDQVEMTYFKSDALGVLFLFAMGIVAIPTFYHGSRYMATHNETPQSRGLFFGALVMMMSACSLAYLSNHIAVTWIFVEITTISASALIYHHRNLRALEGVWKYVFICAISISLIYIGILFLSLAMKQAGIEDMSFTSILNHSNLLNLFWLKLAFLFIFTGFSVKFGLVPMYTAGIDAKDKAPAPAAALLSSVVMNMGFVGIYRIYAIVALTPIQHWASMLMLVSGVLSIFVATVYMTHIKNIKRMFAYSSIEHMGIVAIGLAVGGIGVYAAILHILLHTFIKSGLFFHFNQIYRVFRSKSMQDLGEYFKYNRVGAIVMLLGFISITAMPPSGLFVSEFMVFQSLFQAHYIVTIIVVLILLTTIIWGFGLNVFKLLFQARENTSEAMLPQINSKNYTRDSISQFALMGLAAYLAYAPPVEFVQLMNDAVNLIHL